MRSLPLLSRRLVVLAMVLSGLAGHVSAQVKMGDMWRLRSPSPTGAQLNSIAITPSAAVVAGNGTTAMRSITISHGSAWTATRVNAGTSITDKSYVAYLGSKLVMGSGAVFYQSTDSGVSWQPLATNLSSFEAVLALSAGSGEFMALLRTASFPYTVVLATSTDGSTWTELGTLNGGAEMYPAQVMRNPAGRYVVVGQSYYPGSEERYGAVWSTDNGIDWDTQEMADLYGSLNDVIWTGNRFVAVGGSDALHSVDGITWTVDQDFPGAFGVASSSSLVVAVGNLHTMTSSDDGQTWSAAAPQADPFFPLDVAHDGTAWIAVGSDGTTFTSTNGVNWVRRTPTGTIVSFTDIAHNGLTGSASRYLAMGSDQYAWRSTDGSVWTKVTLLRFPGAEGVTWDGTNFVVVSDFFSSVSTDGNSWSSTGMFGANSQDSDVMIRSAYAGGTYVAIGYDSVTNEPEIYSGTSYDTFVSRTVPAGSGNLQDVTRAGSLWVVVGGEGTILTSPDGTTWTKRAVADNSYYFTHVASTGTLHIASGGSGFGYYTSTNGTTWTRQHPDYSPFSAVGAADGRLFAFGNGESRALVSSDGIDWTMVPLPLTSYIDRVKYNGTEMMAVGDNLRFMSSDLVPEVSFVSASVREFEGSPTATVAVQLSVPASTALAVPIGVLGGGSAVLNTDYGAVPTTVSFAVGQQFGLLEVPLLNDSATDGDKTLNLAVGAVTGIRTGSPNTTTVTLVDDDAPPTIQFTITKRAMAEHGGSAVAQVELSWPAPAAVSASLALSGSAAGGLDYNAPASVSFAVGERIKTINVDILDGNDVENDESVILTLGSITGATAASSNQTLEVSILDNDPSSLAGRRWTLRQPTPTADGLYNIVALGTKLIATGNGGTTVISTDDGVSWTRRLTGLSPELTITSLVVHGGKVYAGADGGHMASSDDGLKWVDRVLPGATPGYYFGGMASNGTRLVVVGDVYDSAVNEYVPILYSSADGEKWTSELLPINRGSLYDVAWNGSVFVAVGNRTQGSSTTTYILTSPDGRSWTPRNNALTGVSLYTVVAAGSSFVGLDHSKNCYVSADGITWTTKTAGSVGEVVSGVWDGSKFIGVGRAITTSSNLTTFSQTAFPDSAWLDDVIHTGSQFVAVGNIGNIYTSPDGVTWTKRSAGFQNYADFNSVVWTGTQFVGVGGTFFQSVPTLIATSPTGTTWTTVPNTLKKELNSVATSGAMLVAVGRNGALATSVNGVAWSLKTSGTTLDLNSVIWARNQFVAVGGHYTGEDGAVGPGGAVVLTSPDGNKWTRRTVPTNRALLSVAYTGSSFIAVGRAYGDGYQPGTAAVVTSPDGVIWTARDGVALTDFTSVAADEFTAVATGYDYHLYSSTDSGVTWTQVANTPAPPAPGSGLLTILRNSNGFVAAGDFGWTLYSPDGITWSASVSETAGAIRALAWNTRMLVAAGTRSTVQTSGSTDPINTSEVTIVGGTMSVPEDSGSINAVVRISPPPPAKVTVTIGHNPLNTTVTLTGPTADITLPTAPLVFNPGETEKYFTIPIKADGLPEADETIELTITSIIGAANPTSTSTNLITVLNDDTTPTVTSTSPSQLVRAGDPLSLTCATSITGPVTVQWKKNNVPLPASVIGSKGNTLFLPSVSLADGGSYTATFTHSKGILNCGPIIIGVYEHQILPANYNGPAATGSFTATQKASSNCVLHWFKDSTEITTALPSGVTMAANRSSLWVKNLAANAGNYYCRVELPGVTMAPHVQASTFLIATAAAPPVIAPLSVLPAATVGELYSYSVILSSGTADTWVATGLPKGLFMINGTISGFPEAPLTKPKTVTITASNGVNKSTIKPTITISPISSTLPGTHVGLLPRQPLSKNLGGIITMTVTQNGYYTASFLLEGERGSVVGRVSSNAGQPTWAARDTTGINVPTAIIGGKKVSVNFNFDGNASPSGSGTITILAEQSVSAVFTSQHVLTGATLPSYAGRYHFALQLKDGPDIGNVSLPQGHGYGSATVSNTGAVSYAGKTADGAVVTASAPLLTGSTCPLYAVLYGSKGSLMAKPTFTLAGVDNADSTIVDTASATWCKLPDFSPANARNYPGGWDNINLKLEGSRYVAPAANAVVMGLVYTPGFFNATAQLDFDSFQDEPDIPSMSVGIKPKGALATPFPDPVTLRLSVTPATGIFSGTANLTAELPNYVSVPRTGAKIEAQVVRIIGAPVQEQAYGFLTVPAMPDYRISPTPAPSTTPFLSVPVTITPLAP